MIVLIIGDIGPDEIGFTESRFLCPVCNHRLVGHVIQIGIDRVSYLRRNDVYYVCKETSKNYIQGDSGCAACDCAYYADVYSPNFTYLKDI